MKEVLLIKLGALGDVIRTTCLLAPLRQKLGPCRLTWVTAPEAVELLEGLGIERIVACDPKTEALLTGERFDLVLNLDEDAAACRAASAPKAERLIGGHLGADSQPAYTTDSAAYFDLGLLNRDSDGRLKRANALKQANKKSYQQLWAGVLGLPMNGYPAGFEPLLSVSERDLSAAMKILPVANKPLVGVNLGSGPRWTAKQPSLEHAAEVVRALAANGYEVALFGGELERERNRRIAQLAAAGIDPGVHSLKVFAALIGRCRALVTTDSLALHLACAVKTPTVVLFGPTSDAEIELFGRGVKLVPKAGCSCYYQATCTAPSHCVDAIAPEDVAAAVSGLLDRSTRPKA